MQIPLILGNKDSKWILLGKILKIFGSRRIKPANKAGTMLRITNKAGTMLRITFIAMFKQLDVGL